ncbi:Protein downstream neighbor of son -like protein [Sarcoptes scabiei]|nr:Protein downstream neighbor of son -like protein [Sarcoptes scabiei]
MDLMRTPTKRPLCSPSKSPLSSPKFLKPSELFKKRIAIRNEHTIKCSPSKATAALRRCKLPIETVEKIYSPLKSLQPRRNECSNTDNDKNKSSRITFSPLMKKLQRSPGRNHIMFPVVKRSFQHSANEISKRNVFSRVLDFNEETQFPEKPLKIENFGESQFVSSSNRPKVDWSLKTRLRIIVNKSIPYHGSFTAIDEATGLNQFVRGSDSTKDNNFCAELQRTCLVWQYPYFPWMNMFPRETELKPGSKLSSMSPPKFTISPSGTIADSLNDGFSSSLQSLFKLLKSKYCPYFYLCANNFCALFRASGVAGSEEAHVLISPTTAGFRRLLEEEKIEYRMPLQSNIETIFKVHDESSKISESSSGIEVDVNDEENDDDEEISDDADNGIEDSNEFLESMGLSQQDFPSLQNSHLRKRRRILTDSTGKCKFEDQTAKGKMKSLIRIDGISQLQELINLLIKSKKVIISSSGLFAGIPPTLLSPVAFETASLVPLNLRSKTNASDSNGSKINSSAIDLSGPILPHTIFELMILFNRLISTSNASKITVTRSTLRTYDQSASFALEAKPDRSESSDSRSLSSAQCQNPAFSVENLLDSGMNRAFLRAICTPENQLHSPLIDFEIVPAGIRYNRLMSETPIDQSSRKTSRIVGSILGTNL